MNTNIDEQHCGGCDAACSSGKFCSGGNCILPRPVVGVALGSRHTCAIVEGADATNLLYCWGDNSEGQLGLEMSGHKGGTPETIPSNLPPVPLPGEPLAVAAGSVHTCAMIVPDGQSENAVYCWGSNGMGQLTGRPGSPLGLEPGDIANAEIDLGTDVPGNIACGRFHCCAITSNATKVRCWGANDFGKVDPKNPSMDVVGAGPAIEFDLPSGYTLLSVLGIAAGAEHSCAHGAMMTAGNNSESWLACWGDNAYGQLGLGHNDAVTLTKAPLLDIGGYKYLRNLVSGAWHTCIQGTVQYIDPSWETKCWGADNAGQLGDGVMTAGNFGPPGGPPALDFGGTDDPDWLTAGEDHTCASMAGFKAWCWGQDQYGQVGDGANMPATFDAPFDLGATPFQFVYTGGSHACAITNDLRLRCWGLNDRGQLGYGDTINRGATPQTTPANLQDILL